MSNVYISRNFELWLTLLTPQLKLKLLLSIINTLVKHYQLKKFKNKKNWKNINLNRGYAPLTKILKVAVAVEILYIKLHTNTLIILKMDGDTVNAVHSSKIHLPPYGLVRGAVAYFLCSHTRQYVSINSKTSSVHVRIYICAWLCGVFIVR